MQDRINQVDETSCNARPDHTLGHSHPVGCRGQSSPCPLCSVSDRSSVAAQHVEMGQGTKSLRSSPPRGSKSREAG